MKKYKASEVAKKLGIESEEVRNLITKIARDRYIDDKCIEVNEYTDRKYEYYFNENSLAYIRNYLFLYGIFGNHQVINLSCYLNIYKSITH